MLALSWLIACSPQGERPRSLPEPSSPVVVDTSDTSAPTTSTDTGPPTSPVATTWLDVDASGDGTCAVRADGALLCWGDASPLLNPPPGTFRAVDLGAGHGCAIRDDGSLACWGVDDAGQAAPPGGNDFVQVSAGWRHSCALDAAGVATCWGDAADGRLDVPPGTYAAIAAGGDHTCVATALGGVVSCVGGDAVGQVTEVTGLRVSQVVPPERALALADDLSCVLTHDDEQIVCAGGGSDTRATDGSGANRTNGGVAVADDFVVHLTGQLGWLGSLSGWGAGLPWPAYDAFPLPFEANVGTAQVAAGADHVCALVVGEALWCTGDNDHGQLDVPD